jgi:CheY-like chemotaxis protein
MASILIIDDDEAVRRSVQIILNANGHQVFCVADGKTGISAARESQFDVVIVDLFMSGMNGLETMKAIRSANPHVPIIAVSGFMFGGSCPEMPDFEAMVTEVGATSTLYKPFRPNDLLQRIRDSIPAAA